MTSEEYERFYTAVTEADKVTPRAFEQQRVFEGCMPIEIMAARGVDTLRFGPMKPVGLPDPKTGREPYAVVQLRAENREGRAYNMVGFQTRLKWPEQKRVFRMISGLENAEFLRYGSLHRNTFINSPLLLKKDLTLKKRENIFIAGQISGVEGYIESTAMGLVAGINAALKMKGVQAVDVPPQTSHGALIRHITESDAGRFQPSNINFGLFPARDGAGRTRNKKLKKMMIAERALSAWQTYLEAITVAL
jgi:methylenetetrahydrofolate--tRNA-(uracil-5-)-methyltransferase